MFSGESNGNIGKKKVKILSNYSLEDNNMQILVSQPQETNQILEYSDLIEITFNKVFKNGRCKICGRQSLKNLKGYGLL